MKKALYKIIIISLILILVNCSNTTNQPQRIETIDSMIEMIDWLKTESPYGSACLRINGDKIIYIDPADISEEQKKIKADIIIVTHPHSDHFSTETIESIMKNSTKIICDKDSEDMLRYDHPEYNIDIVVPGDELKIDDVIFKATPAYGCKQHEKKYNWFGFILSIYGLNIYVTGSTALIEEMNDIKDIDIAIFSIFPPYSLSGEEGIQAVEIIKPQILIPIHWTENNKDDIDYIKENIPEFTKLVILELKE